MNKKTGKDSALITISCVHAAADASLVAAVVGVSSGFSGSWTVPFANEVDSPTFPRVASKRVARTFILISRYVSSTHSTSVLLVVTALATEIVKIC